MLQIWSSSHVYKVVMAVDRDRESGGSTCIQRNRAKYLEEYNHNDAVETVLPCLNYAVGVEVLLDGLGKCLVLLI